MNIALIKELFQRQRELTWFGIVLLALMVVMLGLQLVDARTFNGANVWAKPTRFAASIALFALTNAWFFGYVRPERRRSAYLLVAAWMLIVAGTFEMTWIAFQASQAQASHFNASSFFHVVMYALMGLFAIILIVPTAPLAWEIWRRPAAGLRPDFVMAVVLGLVITLVLGTITGGYMAQQPSHAVGPVGGHIPLLGWNLAGGDLRIAHFLGMHGEQATWLLALGLAGVNVKRARVIVILGAAAWSVLAVLLMVHAARGGSILPT